MKSFKIKNKCTFIIQNLQLMENMYLFQKVKDDNWRHFFGQHLQRINITVRFANNICDKKQLGVMS